MIHRLRPDRVEWREVEGEVVVLDLKASRYLAVNETGTLLWPRLVEGVSEEEMVALLVERFQLDHSAAQQDVSEFLEELRAQDLLE